MTEYVVTRWYKAPELLLNCSEYTAAIDICDNARRYVRQLPRYPKQQFAARFPKMPSSAIDLLERMLIFDPNRRISVDEALGHAYLSPHHDVDKEPVCPTPFSFDFEHPSCMEEHIKELIYKESVELNPDH
ncbi:hypothetical protein N665_0045s0040 [Sinapis alba]|nr:hypothetical protein N665_0045s0040 [Sinapis alba]